MRKFNETQNWFFKKTPKIDKHLDRLMKKGKKNDEEEKEKDKLKLLKSGIKEKVNYWEQLHTHTLDK